MNYRKIYEDCYGSIPNGHEIHHIDGNRANNNIENLVCVTTQRHYDIHYNQGDYMACSIIMQRLCLSDEEKKIVHSEAMKKRDQRGKKNPMYGRSAIRENNMKWYNNGVHESMFVENQQPDGYLTGRLYYHNYDKSGENNPRAKAVIVNGKRYSHIKELNNDFPEVPYSTLKYIARTNKPNKYGLVINYA